VSPTRFGSCYNADGGPVRKGPRPPTAARIRPENPVESVGRVIGAKASLPKTVSLTGGPAAGVAATMDHGPSGTSPPSKTADFNPPVAFGPWPANFSIGDEWGTGSTPACRSPARKPLAVAELPTADPAEVTGSGAATTDIAADRDYTPIFADGPLWVPTCVGHWMIRRHISPTPKPSAA
jgi:hypothetical protein